jgi:hypothetical protein
VQTGHPSPSAHQFRLPFNGLSPSELRRIFCSDEGAGAAIDESTGVGRTTIFEAIRNEELTARKAGNRTTLIECEEARRWLRSLPWRGRPPEITTANAAA